ncbi:uncharacterized protein PG998_007263 [Apiospora kogelbergensis]|uniref:uncharacterized protein n=1 Tax=Apiospora kogelbergensis TaxID=1337665 RepID=UPI0031329665
MAKARSARSGMPGRADSLSRMLELEKHYKLQRTQDNGSIHPTPPGPIGTRPSPSALPDSALRVRRASAHPPPTQNMKAARRSAGLPSLSISIPPSPTSAQGAEEDDDDPTPTENQELVVESQKEPGERTKTVTFSGPQEDEVDDLSDAASSICHSPSWEGFGQSAKKKAKKREKKEKKKLEEKAIKASKKQSNRLSKVPPPETQGVQALKASDRSLSTPNLEQQPAKFNPRSLLTRSTSDFPHGSHGQSRYQSPGPRRRKRQAQEQRVSCEFQKQLHWTEEDISTQG